MSEQQLSKTQQKKLRAAARLAALSSGGAQESQEIKLDPDTKTTEPVKPVATSSTTTASTTSATSTTATKASGGGGGGGGDNGNNGSGDDEGDYWDSYYIGEFDQPVLSMDDVVIRDTGIISAPYMSELSSDEWNDIKESSSLTSSASSIYGRTATDLNYNHATLEFGFLAHVGRDVVDALSPGELEGYNDILNQFRISDLYEAPKTELELTLFAAARDMDFYNSGHPILKKSNVKAYIAGYQKRYVKFVQAFRKHWNSVMTIFSEFGDDNILADFYLPLTTARYSNMTDVERHDWASVVRCLQLIFSSSGTFVVNWNPIDLYDQAQMMLLFSKIVRKQYPNDSPLDHKKRCNSWPVMLYENGCSKSIDVNSLVMSTPDKEILKAILVEPKDNFTPSLSRLIETGFLIAVAMSLKRGIIVSSFLFNKGYCPNPLSGPGSENLVSVLEYGTSLGSLVRSQEKSKRRLTNQKNTSVPDLIQSSIRKRIALKRKNADIQFDLSDSWIADTIEEYISQINDIHEGFTDAFLTGYNHVSRGRNALTLRQISDKKNNKPTE